MSPDELAQTALQALVAARRPTLFQLPTQLSRRACLVLFHLASARARPRVLALGDAQDGCAAFLDAAARRAGGTVEWLARGARREQRSDVDVLFVGPGASPEDAAHALATSASPGAGQLVLVWEGGRDANGGAVPALREVIRSSLVPRQTEAGRRVDGLYWTRVARAPRPRPTRRATIIIPTNGARPSLLRALATARNQSMGSEELEVLIAYNGARAPDALIAAAAAPGGADARVITEERNGLHEVRHAGARAARGEILVYIDDDITVEATWLQALLTPFADASVGASGGPIRPVWEQEPPAWLSEFPPAYLSLLDLGPTPRVLGEGEDVFGCNLAVRASVFLEVGGFHPDAFSDPAARWRRGDGETGFTSKIRDAGHGIAWVPDAPAAHHIPAERLTPEALVRRGALIGESMSFAHLRALGDDPLFLARIAARMARAHRRARALRPPGADTSVRNRAEASLWRAYAQHHGRALVSAAVRRWTFQDTYLDMTGPRTRDEEAPVTPAA